MTETIWNGYKRIEFIFEGRTAIVVFPNEPNEKKNWLLKTEYFAAFQGFELQMLARGWHLAYVGNKSRWDFAEDLDIKKRFAKYLQETYGLADKCFPVGMSCGGMIAVELAAKHPDMISALYLDAPVMNLLSCPAGLGKAGDIIGLEVNMRPSGGYTPDMYNFAHETDVYKIWADMIAFDKSTKPQGNSHICAFIGRRDEKSYQMTHDDIMAKYGYCMKMQGRVPVALSGAMGDQLYMANFDTEEDMNRFYSELMA
jgi:hypothetical protein